MSQVDVLVVGGGPAGLVAARTIAARGYDVLVLERQRSVGETVRTSGATATTTVSRFGIPADLYHRVGHIRIASPTADASFDCGDDALCVLDVRGTYRWLAESAQAAGATIQTGATALGPLVERSSVAGCLTRVAGERGSVSARVVVDAGGYRAQLSRRASLHPGFTRFGVGAEYELVAPRLDQDDLVLLVSDRHAPSGYAWAFPWGDGRVRLGVGVHHGDVRADPRAHLDLLWQESADFGLDLTGAETREVHRGLVPAAPVAERFAGDGIVAVGDAAGQATLVAGEGIRLSMIAGEMAGETIASALDRDRTDRAALEPYEQRFRTEFARGLEMGYALNRRLARCRDGDWDQSLRILQSMPSQLVLDLLQSQASAPALLRWLIRRPKHWRRAVRLARGFRTSLGPA